MNRLGFTFLIFLKHGRNIFACAFLLILKSWSTAFAQSAKEIMMHGSRASNILTSVPFLLITPQARAGAMGNAGVAVEADANSPSLDMAY